MKFLQLLRHQALTRALKVAAVAVLALIVILSLSYIPRYIFNQPIKRNSDVLSRRGISHQKSLPKPAPVSIAYPLRLKIPVIKVDAAVEYMGRTADGAMDVPKVLADVAWFKLGPPPGGTGSAVIAGHYGWRNGEAAVFNNLNKLNQGDYIYVEDDKGATSAFRVSQSRSYDPKADASEVFNSNDGKSHLNLITCEGVWNNVSKGYSQRLVVFADKV